MAARLPAGSYRGSLKRSSPPLTLMRSRQPTQRRAQRRRKPRIYASIPPSLLVAFSHGKQPDFSLRFPPSIIISSPVVYNWNRGRGGDGSGRPWHSATRVLLSDLGIVKSEGGHRVQTRFEVQRPTA